MSKKNNISGIILAGGKSSRMGTDKGFVLYQGKTFIQHVIEAMAPLVNDLIIVSDNRDYDIFNCIRVDDIIKNSGPLAGLYSGLNYSKTEYNLVVSCDVPLINNFVLQKLIDQIPSEADIIQLQAKERDMPLLAIYKKECCKQFLDLLCNNERKLTNALLTFDVKKIVLDKTLEHFTANINTINELNDL